MYQPRGSSIPEPGSITNAMLADMLAHTFKGRNTNSTGAPEDVTIAQMLSLLQAGGAVKIETPVFQTANVTAATSGAWADISGLSITITPLSAAHTIILFAFGGYAYSSTFGMAFRFANGGTPLQVADASGARIQSAYANASTVNNQELKSFAILSSTLPASVAAQTITLQWNSETGSTAYLNRSVGNVNNAEGPIGITSIFAMQAIL